MTYAFALPIPTLTTARLTLRPPREGDFPAMLPSTTARARPSSAAGATGNGSGAGFWPISATGPCAATASIRSTRGRATRGRANSSAASA